jgi:hypothetical protein
VLLPVLLPFLAAALTADPSQKADHLSGLEQTPGPERGVGRCSRGLSKMRLGNTLAEDKVSGNIRPGLETLTRNL